MEQERNRRDNNMKRLLKRASILGVLAFFFLLHSCGNKKVPSDILPPEKMQAVMWDLLRSDELAMEKKAVDTGFILEAGSEKMYQQVFAMHGIDKNTFEKSFSFYKGRPDLSKAIFDSLINAGNRYKELLRKADSTRTAKETAALAKADSIKRRTDSIQRRTDSIKLRTDSTIRGKLKVQASSIRKIPARKTPK